MGYVQREYKILRSTAAMVESSSDSNSEMEGFSADSDL